MAEKPDWVAGFERPAGTELKHIGGHWYLYEATSVYDPAIGRSRKRSGRILGRVDEDGFHESRARAAERAGSPAAPAPSEVVELGATSYLWASTAGMRESLARHLPGLWRQAYAAAVIRAAHGPRLRRLQAHYEDSALAWALPGLSFSPSSVRAMLRGLGGRRDAIRAYMREALEAGGRFLLVDGHRLLSSSRGVLNAELGYDSKARYSPQVNLMYMFSMGASTAAPAYYKQYLGSTPDCSAMPDLLAESGAPAAGCTAVADKGHASEADFAALAAAGLRYVVPLRRGNRFTKGRVPASPAGYSGAFTHLGRAVQFETFPQDGFDVHLFFDADLFADEMADLTARLEGRSDAAAARRAAELERRARGKGRLTDGQLAELEPVDVTAAYAERAEMGTLAIRTDRTDLTPRAVYEIYKQRQAVEQLFKTYDDSLSFDASYMRDDRSMEAWLFLNHLSATMAVAAIEDVAAAGQSKSVSYEDLVQTLAKVRACRTADGSWAPVPVKKATASLCAKIGFDPEDVSLLKQPPLV